MNVDVIDNRYCQKAISWDSKTGTLSICSDALHDYLIKRLGGSHYNRRLVHVTGTPQSTRRLVSYEVEILNEYIGSFNCFVPVCWVTNGGLEILTDQRSYRVARSILTSLYSEGRAWS